MIALVKLPFRAPQVELFSAFLLHTIPAFFCYTFQLLDYSTASLALNIQRYKVYCIVLQSNVALRSAYFTRVRILRCSISDVMLCE